VVALGAIEVRKIRNYLLLLSFHLEDETMREQRIKPTDEPLTSRDLAVCQSVHNTVCDEQKCAPGSQEANRVAAITIHLYRQGVRDEQKLLELVRAARAIQLRA
jgi:hypothetical protein